MCVDYISLPPTSYPLQMNSVNNQPIGWEFVSFGGHPNELRLNPQ